MEKGLITFFDVPFAGFYQIKKNSDPLHVNGNLSEILDRVIEWAKKRDLVDTLPWDPAAHKYRQQYFLKSAMKHSVTGDYLLVFLKKTSDDSGNFKGFKAQSKFGDAKGDTVKVGKKVGGAPAIFGEPMYYWYSPECNKLASINFPHSVSDTKNMCEYLKKCIELRVNLPNKVIHERSQYNAKAGRDVLIKNIYFKTPDGKKSLKLYLDFVELRVDIKKVNYKELAARITHIITRDVIKSKDIGSEKHPLLSMFDKFLNEKSKGMNNKHVQVETEVSLTPSELKKLIEIHEAEYDPVHGWVNIGFKVEGSDSAKFFNSYMQRESIYIDPQKKIDDHYFEPQTVLEVINENRSDLLSSFLNNDDSVMSGTGTHE
ncbi:hypothetical protein FJN13_07935 [Alteromonas mediterranea]|uniref:hypothetical protein n=1 Tax=Alteromonas mediterranea TaxID=314275 RepID=UPI00113289A0|nr:hypothetical protein [Alteromonas mediterranea]QDG34722.1 hypothetical protein FJN13_07935 [Alteromonas mediterranea]